MPLLEFLTEPFQYAFMVKALIVSIVVGITCAILSCFLILKNWALLGDAVSHAVLPGVVIAYMLGIPFGIGAFIFALLSVVMIGFIKNNSKIKEDAVMGIVFTTLFALGLIMISKIVSPGHLMHILFGQVLGISDSAAWLTAITMGVVAAIILLFRKVFMVFCFDPTHARTIGMPMTFVHYAFLVLLAIVITGSIQTVGIILVIAMLIIPGSTAFLLTKRFPTMLQLAIVTSLISSIVGVYASYYFDVSTGGTIVFVQGLIFLSVFTFQLLRSRKLA